MEDVVVWGVWVASVGLSLRVGFTFLALIHVNVKGGHWNFTRVHLVSSLDYDIHGEDIKVLKWKNYQNHLTPGSQI